MSETNRRQNDMNSGRTPGDCRYYFVDNRSLVVKHVPAHQEDDFFQAIETLTGLDRAIAQGFLDAGKPIDHPSYTFYRVAD
jgi:hypothetical protein